MIKCQFCKQSIDNQLVLIVDDMGFGYWVFDSLECAAQYSVDHGFNHRPLFDNESVDRLRSQTMRKSGWSIKTYNKTIINRLIEEGKVKCKKKIK